MRKVVLAIILLFVTSAPAFACSCIYQKGSQADHVRREFNAADAVFSAYVQSIHHSEIDGLRTRMAKLRILQVWKGSLEPNSWIDVVSDDDSGLCSYGAESDRALMVYAHGQKRPYSLVSCSLTGPLERATSDIPLLIKLSKRQRGK